MKIVLASDKFKGSLSAVDVSAALARGLRRVLPDVETVRVPVADGGDGTLAAFADAGFELFPVSVEGPTGEVVDTAYARRGDVAVVELADASGLARLGAGLAPLTASTIGTGQALRAALEAGCRELVLGVGGSASTDGGLGMLLGLGATVGGDGLADAHALDLTGVRRLLDGAMVTLAADVDNPLTGPLGAAAVYAPQKGATPEQVRDLDDALSRWAGVVAATTGQDHRDSPGAGAAGGAGFAALAVLDARRRPGIDVVLELVGFEQTLVDADLVVTGEGSLDEQSLHGKAPIGVVGAARRLGVPVVAVCGRTTLSDARLREAGIDRTWTLTDLELDPEVAMSDAARLLEEVGALVGAWLSGQVDDGG